MSKVSSWFFALLTGGAVGWIMGLSTSPVVATVIASLLSIGFGAIAVVSGFNVLGIQSQGEDNRSSTLSLIALFSAALAVAGTMGLDYRSGLALKNIRNELVFWTEVVSNAEKTDSISASVGKEMYLRHVVLSQTTSPATPSQTRSPDAGFVSGDSKELSMVRNQAMSIISLIQRNDTLSEKNRDDYFGFLVSIAEDQSIQDSTKLQLLSIISKYP